MHTVQSFSKSVKALKTQKQRLGCYCATWVQLWNVLGSTGLCQSCFGGQKGSGDHFLVSILTLWSPVAGLDKMLTIFYQLQTWTRGLCSVLKPLAVFPPEQRRRESEFQSWSIRYHWHVILKGVTWNQELCCPQKHTRRMRIPNHLPYAEVSSMTHFFQEQDMEICFHKSYWRSETMR